jgi:hypothetical protein
MLDKNLAPPCGIFCGTCENLNNKCKGCEYQKGAPFWVSKMKISTCPLYDCCVNKNGLEYCGLCDKLPCQLFNSFYDPSLNLEEAKKSVNLRQNELLKRKELGTKKWLKIKSAK